MFYIADTMWVIFIWDLQQAAYAWLNRKRSCQMFLYIFRGKAMRFLL